MNYALPPDVSGRLDGIAYNLFLPIGDTPAPAVVILHGAGSRKENHADFARAATSQGFAALTFDNRGHGETAGDLDGGVIADLGQLVGMLADRPEVDSARIALRGSSMGGLLAIHGGAEIVAVAAVVAICPASEDLFASDIRRLARGGAPPEGSALESMRIDAESLADWLDRHDVRDAGERIGAKPLMLVHARGDEVVPYTISEEIHARAAEPKRLLLLESGHHRSAQHDPEIQGEIMRWLSRSL